MAEIRVGVSPPERFEVANLAERRAGMDRIGESGLDHVFFADHVSFHTGMGLDGMVQAAALSQFDERVSVYIGVYLLALRHPVTVARQLSTLSEYAPGRVVLGVGVGGEDRHEMEVCGVDPATRGRRTDECLAILRGLADGDAFDFDGEFFQLENARITPPPVPAIPITIGGRADAALRRCARYGDGWIATWRTPDKIAAGVARIGELAAEYDRTVDFEHGLQLWCAVGDDHASARPFVADQMERFYQIPFDRFERHVPCGTPEQIADFLHPFIEAGCRTFNMKTCAATFDEAVDGAAEVRRLLQTG